MRTVPTTAFLLTYARCSDPGARASWEDWWDDVHLGDVAAAVGANRATRWTLTAEGPAAHAGIGFTHVAMHGLTGGDAKAGGEAADPKAAGTTVDAADATEAAGTAGTAVDAADATEATEAAGTTDAAGTTVDAADATEAAGTTDAAGAAGAALAALEQAWPKWWEAGRVHERHVLAGADALVGHGPNGVHPDPTSELTGRILAFITCTDPRRTAEWDAWYDAQHLPDMMDTGAFTAGSRWARIRPAPFAPRLATLYDIAGMPVEEAVRRSGEAMPGLVAAGRKPSWHAGGMTLVLRPAGRLGGAGWSAPAPG
jgi:hypothetical protein